MKVRGILAVLEQLDSKGRSRSGSALARVLLDRSRVTESVSEAAEGG